MQTQNLKELSEEQRKFMDKAYIEDDNSFESYTFIGKIILIFGIICLLCFTIIVISFTIMAVRMWI